MKAKAEAEARRAEEARRAAEAEPADAGLTEEKER